MLSYHELTTETKTGLSDSFLLPSAVGGIFFVNVTDLTGTFTIKIQHSPDNIYWYDVKTLSISIVQPGQYTATLAPMVVFADYTRISWTLDNAGQDATVTFSADLAVRS